MLSMATEYNYYEWLENFLPWCETLHLEGNNRIYWIMYSKTYVMFLWQVKGLWKRPRIAVFELKLHLVIMPVQKMSLSVKLGKWLVMYIQHFVHTDIILKLHLEFIEACTIYITICRILFSAKTHLKGWKY